MPNLSSEVLRNLVYRYVNSSLTYPLYTRKWRAFEVFKTRRNPQALLHISNTIYYISINYITNINFKVCAQLYTACRVTTPHLPLRTSPKQDKTAAPGMASMVQRLYLIMAYKIRCKDSPADGCPQ